MAFVTVASIDACTFEVDVVGTQITRFRVTNLTARTAVQSLARLSDRRAARLVVLPGQTVTFTVPTLVRNSLTLRMDDLVGGLGRDLPVDWQLEGALLPLGRTN